MMFSNIENEERFINAIERIAKSLSIYKGGDKSKENEELDFDYCSITHYLEDIAKSIDEIRSGIDGINKNTEKGLVI